MRAPLLLLALAGCTRTPVDDPFVGNAFPDTRRAVVLPSDFALVPSSGSDRLTLIDLGSSRKAASVPIGRPVLLDGPHQVAVDLDRKIAFVLEAYPETLESAGNHAHGSSQRDGWVQGISLGTLAPVSEVRVDPNPGEIALSEDGKRLVVTHFDLAASNKPALAIEARRSTLAVIDPAEMKPFGTPEPDKLLVCAAPHGLALSRPHGDVAFVACYGEDAIAIVNLASPHEPVVRIPMGARPNESGQPLYGPYGIALSPDGTRIAASMRLSKQMLFVDVAGQKRDDRSITTIGEPYVPAWSSDGKRLFVPTRNVDAISVVDVQTGDAIARRVFEADTCIAPVEAVMGESLFVVCEGDGKRAGAVVRLDPTTLETKGRVEVGLFPGRPFVGHRR